ncbi:hypothetical protein HZS_6458 [Henneguya salminicola]|nr:hypothetical protein HZS_6458 [Henneguya salminicola]
MIGTNQSGDIDGSNSDVNESRNQTPQETRSRKQFFLDYLKSRTFYYQITLALQRHLV